VILAVRIACKLLNYSCYNHGVTSLRLGGNADLTIEYTGYRIIDASQLSSLEITRSTLHAEPVMHRSSPNRKSERYVAMVTAAADMQAVRASQL
jgi:hypothetical protein